LSTVRVSIYERWVARGLGVRNVASSKGKVAEDDVHRYR